MKSADFLSVRDMSGKEIAATLSLARSMKANKKKYRKALDGKTLALILEKPSLRTRTSFDVGIQQLGGFRSIYPRPRSAWENANRSTMLRRISSVW